MTVQTNLRVNSVLRRRDSRVSFTQVITPEDATRMLEEMMYLHQRPLRQAKVRAYADEMRSGAFCELTQIYIAIYHGRYVILDGQHRLRAVESSGVPVLFSIVEKDVESEEEMARIYSKIDIGTRRTPGDIYGAYDLGTEFDLTPTAIRRLGSTVNFMGTGCMTVGKQTSYDEQISNMGLYAPYMREYWAMTTSGNIVGPSKASIIRSSTIALALLTLRFSTATAEKRGDPPPNAFWAGALLDDGLKIGDPRKAAFRHLAETRVQTHTGRGMDTVSAAYSFRYLASCFNAYMASREIRFPKVLDEFAPVNVYGVPSDPAKWW